MMGMSIIFIKPSVLTKETLELIGCFINFIMYLKLIDPIIIKRKEVEE